MAEKQSTSSIQNLIRAAGGLLWRRAGSSWQIAVIHRPRYDDWTLPKGKLKSGETWSQAAQREVLEETGYAASLAGFAGAVAYTTAQGPKLVRFWHMLAVESAVRLADDEVSEVAWLLREEALERLQYPLDQAILETWEGPGVAYE